MDKEFITFAFSTAGFVFGVLAFMFTAVKVGEHHDAKKDKKYKRRSSLRKARVENAHELNELQTLVFNYQVKLDIDKRLRQDKYWVDIIVDFHNEREKHNEPGYDYTIEYMKSQPRYKKYF